MSSDTNDISGNGPAEAAAAEMAKKNEAEARFESYRKRFARLDQLVKASGSKGKKDKEKFKDVEAAYRRLARLQDKKAELDFELQKFEKTLAPWEKKLLGAVKVEKVEEKEKKEEKEEKEEKEAKPPKVVEEEAKPAPQKEIKKEKTKEGATKELIEKWKKEVKSDVSGKKEVPAAKAMERVGRVRDLEDKLMMIEPSAEKEALLWKIINLGGVSNEDLEKSLAWTETSDSGFDELLRELEKDVNEFIKKSTKEKSAEDSRPVKSEAGKAVQNMAELKAGSAEVGEILEELKKALGAEKVKVYIARFQKAKSITKDKKRESVLKKLEEDMDNLLATVRGAEGKKAEVPIIEEKREAAAAPEAKAPVVAAAKSEAPKPPVEMTKAAIKEASAVSSKHFADLEDTWQSTKEERDASKKLDYDAKLENERFRLEKIKKRAEMKAATRSEVVSAGQESEYAEKMKKLRAEAMAIIRQVDKDDQKKGHLRIPPLTAMFEPATNEQVIAGGAYWGVKLVGGSDSEALAERDKMAKELEAMRPVKKVEEKKSIATEAKVEAKKEEASVAKPAERAFEAEIAPITLAVAKGYIEQALKDKKFEDYPQRQKATERDTIISGAYWRARYSGIDDKEAQAEARKVWALYSKKDLPPPPVETAKAIEPVKTEAAPAAEPSRPAAAAAIAESRPATPPEPAEHPAPAETTMEELRAEMEEPPLPPEGAAAERHERRRKILDIKEFDLWALIGEKKLREVVNEIILGNRDVAEVLLKDIFSRKDMDLDHLNAILEPYDYTPAQFMEVWANGLYKRPFDVTCEWVEQMSRNWLNKNIGWWDKLKADPIAMSKLAAVNILPSVTLVAGTAVAAASLGLSRVTTGMAIGGTAGVLRGLKTKVTSVRNWFGKKAEQAKEQMTEAAESAQAIPLRDELLRRFSEPERLEQLFAMMSQGLRDASAAVALGADIKAVKANAEVAIEEVREDIEREFADKGGPSGEAAAVEVKRSQEERMETLMRKLYDHEDISHLIQEAIAKDPKIVWLFQKMDALKNFDFKNLLSGEDRDPVGKETDAQKVAAVLASGMAGAAIGGMVAATPELRAALGAIAGGILGAKLGNFLDREAREEELAREYNTAIYRAEHGINDYEAAARIGNGDRWLRDHLGELRDRAKNLRAPLSLGVLDTNINLQLRAKNALRRIEAIQLADYLVKGGEAEARGEKNTPMENLLTNLNADLEESTKEQQDVKARLIKKPTWWRTVAYSVGGALAGAGFGYGSAKWQEMRALAHPHPVGGKGVAVGEVMAVPGGSAWEKFMLSHDFETSAKLHQLIEKYPELENEESLQKIYDATRVGRDIHSAHSDIIKGTIDTFDEGGGERNSVIFEQLLKHGNQEHAAGYLDSQQLSGKHLGYLPAQAKADHFLSFAKKYDEVVMHGNKGNKSELIKDLFKAFRGKESTNLSNVGLEADATSAHGGKDVLAIDKAGKELHYWGVDKEKAAPILSGEGTFKTIETHAGIKIPVFVDEGEKGMPEFVYADAEAAKQSFGVIDTSSVVENLPVEPNVHNIKIPIIEDQVSATSRVEAPTSTVTPEHAVAVKATVTPIGHAKAGIETAINTKTTTVATIVPETSTKAGADLSAVALAKAEAAANLPPVGQPWFESASKLDHEYTDGVKLKAEWNIVQDPNGALRLISKGSMKGFSPEKYFDGNIESLPPALRVEALRSIRVLYTENRIVHDAGTGADLRPTLGEYLARRVENLNDKLDKYNVSVKLPE